MLTASPLRLQKAAESLCMNGRALNEKAIEVSPSSSRVLDRAADILTPFPPSKNRPRPGDWTCPSCGFSNFQRRTACFRCSFPLNGAPDQYNYGYSYGHPTGMMPPPHHMGGHGHMMGHVRGGGAAGGGAVPFRAGDWKCGGEGCNYHNFAKNVTCLRCGASRAGAAVVADSAFPSPGPIDTPSSFGMGPPSMGATPGPASFGAPGAFGSAPSFPGQQFGAPPSTYALPSGIAGANPYPPMNAQYAPNGGIHATPFDSRAAEAAFSSAGNQMPSSGPSFSNGNFSEGPSADPFHFLSTGLGGLSMSGDDRRNGPNSSTKSPQ
jgi:hypothetical protein